MTIYSGYKINVENFKQYCLKTAERYLQLYNWYYMPTSVYKLLIHGAVTVQHAIVPIDELSEEAQEAKNKDIKRYRLYHASKINALKVNEDLFNRLILSSDPYLSSFSCGKNKIRHVDEDMRPLVIMSENETKRNEVDEYIDDEESELVEGFEEEIDYESDKCEQNEEEKDDEVEEENDEGVEKAKEEDFKDEQHRTI